MNIRHTGIRASMAFATLALLVGTAQAQVTLRYSSWLPPKHTLRTDVFEPWAEKVKLVTNGRVVVDFLPKLVGSVPGQYDVIKDGQADVSWIVNGTTPGRLTLTEIGELPFMGDDAEVTSPVWYKFYESRLAKYNEYQGVHVLSAFPVGSGHVYTIKKPFRAIGDLKGLKIRNPQGSTLPILAALGAVPVQKPVTEIYELASAGVVDGTLLNREAVHGYKLTGTLKNLTIIPGGLYNTVLSLIVNERKWSEISPTDREAIMKVSGAALATEIGKVYNRIDAEGVAELRKAGGNVEMASPELMKELRAAMKPIEQAWADNARKKGLADPEKAIEELRAEIAAASKLKEARK